jgi:hypothetical protein
MTLRLPSAGRVASGLGRLMPDTSGEGRANLCRPDAPLYVECVRTTRVGHGASLFWNSGSSISGEHNWSVAGFGSRCPCGFIGAHRR